VVRWLLHRHGGALVVPSRWSLAAAENSTYNAGKAHW
jgi:hypothetical protein